MSELDTLIGLLAKLPGLGPRSARRAALHLIKRRESIMEPLAVALRDGLQWFDIHVKGRRDRSYEKYGLIVGRLRPGPPRQTKTSNPTPSRSSRR